MNESLIYITADGLRYPLDGKRVVNLDQDGTGLPEIDYITQKGPFQHGETIQDYFLQPRIIQLTLRRLCKCRDDYWRERQRLINVLRPNRGQGVIRKVLQDGTKRDIKVYIQQGPSFPTRGNWDETTIQETLRFIAHNPVWYNPVQQTQTYAPVGAPVGTFPITFPFTFESYDTTATITYNGNWIDYPSIVVTGPISNFRIYNATTDEELRLLYDLSAGRTITFDLSYGNKTITLDDGTNLIPYISEDSDLATFHLEPGSNVIQVSGSGVVSGMTVVVNWYERYIALGGAA